MKKIEKAYIYKYNTDCAICHVYGYDLNTIKEMLMNGWKLTGTYLPMLTFRLDLE